MRKKLGTIRLSGIKYGGAGLRAGTRYFGRIRGIGVPAADRSATDLVRQGRQYLQLRTLGADGIDGVQRPVAGRPYGIAVAKQPVPRHEEPFRSYWRDTAKEDEGAY